MVGGPVHRRRGAGVCRRRGGAFRARPECWGDDSLAARGGRRGQALPRRRSRGPPLDVHAEVTTRKVDPLNELRQRKYEAGHGDAEAFNRQHAKGKLTARERISRLVDRNSFEEIDLFARHSGGVPGDGVVTGLAKIDGRDVMLFSHDASVFGGSLGEVFAEKVIKVMDLAVQNRIPIIGINDSGGARIQEGVVSLAGYAEIFWRNVEASGLIPQLSLILGPCTGGAVYSPAITDFTFMVHGVGYMFITGPEVVRVTTGEDVTFDSLGGAEVHNVRSGVAHFLAESEEECFTQVRKLFKYIPQSCEETPPLVDATDEATVPKLTVITRKAYGGAYCVMCSKHIRADFNVAWPTAEIAVMGPEGAVNILFRRELAAGSAQRSELVSDYTERFANPYIAAERGYIDDVIEPGRTRAELIRALRIAMRKERRPNPRWHGNIPL